MGSSQEASEQLWEMIQKPTHLYEGDRCLLVHVKQCFTDDVAKKCFTPPLQDGVSFAMAEDYLQHVLGEFSGHCGWPPLYTPSQMTRADISPPKEPDDDEDQGTTSYHCLLYTSPSPRD